jgi:hypothetical protein
MKHCCHTKVQEEEQQQQQKEECLMMMKRNSLSDELPRRKRSSTLIQSLNPKTLIPVKMCKGLDRMQELDKIIKIEVSDVITQGKKKNGKKNYVYVIDVYLYHENSRIPTNQKKCVLQARSQPDYQVYHTFEEFNALRHQIHDSTTREHWAFCRYCDEMSRCCFAAMLSPRLWIPFGSRKSLETRRKDFLNQFLFTIVNLGRTSYKGYEECQSLVEIPSLIEDFLELPQEFQRLPEEPAHY